MKINPLLDARSLTDYRPNCVIENSIMKSLNVTNNRDFKNSLMSNGVNITAKQNQDIIDQLKQLHSQTY